MTHQSAASQSEHSEFPAGVGDVLECPVREGHTEGHVDELEVGDS